MQYMTVHDVTPAAGVVLLGDPASPLRLACIGLIVLGIIGLKLA